MEWLMMVDNIILWSLFLAMVRLRFVKGWFKPRQHHTDHLIEIAIALPFNYLSTHWSLEAFIVLLSWWTIDEWRFQTKGRSFKDETKLFGEKIWG